MRNRSLPITAAILAGFAGVVWLRTESGTRCTPHTEGGTAAIRPDSDESIQLDEPGQVDGPTVAEVAELEQVALRHEPAMMYVGHPEGDSGTAFVISRKHRLLATNSHVAEIFGENGAMVAVANGAWTTHRVERVWHHPEYRRVLDEGVSVRVGGRWIVVRAQLAPDVAVLQLAAVGPELPGEFRLGRPGELDGVLRRPVGLLGYSGPDPMPGDPPRARFRSGKASLITEVDTIQGGTSPWRLIDATYSSGSGDSGGPVFLADGLVVGIHTWTRTNPTRPGVSSSTSVRVDALWRLLEHHRLTSLVPGP